MIQGGDLTNVYTDKQSKYKNRNNNYFTLYLVPPAGQIQNLYGYKIAYFSDASAIKFSISCKDIGLLLSRLYTVSLSCAFQIDGTQ